MATWLKRTLPGVAKRVRNKLARVGRVEPVQTTEAISLPFTTTGFIHLEF